MSTNDVPGYREENADVLAMGCWAEHDDGSLIFVEGVENNRVIYSIFDLSKDPPIEFRHAMKPSEFKRTFSWEDDTVKAKSKKQNEKWVWHDKTPFPWSRVSQDFEEGVRAPSASHIMTAAERVAQRLHLRGVKMTRDLSHLSEKAVLRSVGIWDKIKRAVDELRK